MHLTNGLGNSVGLLNEVQAAKVLNLSTRTLQAWRTKGSGPAFVRAGRAIRYRISDIAAWVEDNVVPPNLPSIAP